MKFSQLAKYLDELEITASRNELVRILSELFQKVSVGEIAQLLTLFKVV